uniref:Major facilitator superfamily (MFS) profile domain-containing protein n=1 Tax=Megaselia scalaris TaxID=36166 RepID=T1H1Q3_MEGSC
MFGRFGSMIAPMTLFLAKYFPEAPTILFGTCALVSGFLSFLMPETKKTVLPNTIEEATRLQRKLS